MTTRILVMGVSHNALAPEQRQRIAACHAVVASDRFAPLVRGLCDTVLPVAPLAAMLDALAAALAGGDVAVLASGDPLFFGIGRTLIRRFGGERLVFFPALSAVQLACARFRVPWDDMAFLSLHGRDGGEVAARILAQRKVMLFTDQRNSPDRIAALLLARLGELGDRERIRDLRVRVAENLGLADERLVQDTLAGIAARRFAPLNMMLIEQEGLQEAESPLGLNEDEIRHSRGLITKDEVRAVTLHRLRLPARGVFWDVGAGSGSVALEAARCCPGLQVLAVEQKKEQQDNIRANIVRHRAWNVRLVAGSAPGVLAGLPDPDRVFIGGSGGRLEQIIDACAGRLAAGGRLVVNAVLPATAELAPARLAAAGLAVDIRRLRVERQARPGAEWQELNPITIITARK